MLTINPINFTRKFNYNKKNNSNYTPVELKSLSFDTVCFKGQRELTDIREIVQNSEADFQEIHKNAIPVAKRLKKTMENALRGLTETDDQNGIIKPISIRIKSPESIEEKVISILAEAVKKADPSMLFKIESSESIKSHIDDIIGARITLKQSNPENNAQIIDRLIELINDKNNPLKIKKVEVITVPASEKISPYFAPKDIARLEQAINKKRNSNNQIKVITKESKTGYCAMHIDVDLSDKNSKAIYDGYNGEIQILGLDVAMLKDVEDYCYKVKQGKAIMCGHPAYKAFANHLNKYFKYHDKDLSDEGNKEMANTYLQCFQEYTRRAYIIQRKKNQNAPDYNVNHLPTLEECSMKGQLPPDLDFNHLKEIKEKCDEIYRISNADDIGSEIDSIVSKGRSFFAALSKVRKLASRAKLLRLLQELYLLSPDNK